MASRKSLISLAPQPGFEPEGRGRDPMLNAISTRVSPTWILVDAADRLDWGGIRRFYASWIKSHCNDLASPRLSASPPNSPKLLAIGESHRRLRALPRRGQDPRALHGDHPQHARPGALADRPLSPPVPAGSEAPGPQTRKGPESISRPRASLGRGYCVVPGMWEAPWGGCQKKIRGRRISTRAP